MTTRSWDALAATATMLALVMLVVYVGLTMEQDGGPAPWFVSGLGLAALLCAYGVASVAPHRKLALLVSGTIMIVLGVLGILSVGLPILIAGALALIAATRNKP